MWSKAGVIEAIQISDTPKELAECADIDVGKLLIRRVAHVSYPLYLDS